MDLLQVILRWVHIVFGIIWLGIGYYVAFILSPTLNSLDESSRRTLLPHLLPRIAWWTRMAAIVSWVTGILLLGLVFHHGRIVFESGYGWRVNPMPGGIMMLVVLCGAFLYDLLAKSKLAEIRRALGIVCFLFTAIIVVLMAEWAHFTYRSINIHLGTLFGTIMAFNVLYRVVPNLRTVARAFADGETPDPALLEMARTRTRHSIYLSVPLLWMMMNQHTTLLAGGAMGIPDQYSFVVLLGIVMLGWHIVFHLYKRAEKVKGA